MNAHLHPCPAPIPRLSLLVLLCGPAGSGKGTLKKELLSAGLGFERVVTATTRPRRDGETDGVDYIFLTPSEFTLRQSAGEFLEWAYVHGHDDPYRMYGTLKDSVVGPLSRGSRLVVDIDVQGAASYREAALSDQILRRALRTVFVIAGYNELRARMRGRGDDESEIERRIATAGREILSAPLFDYIIESRTRNDDFAALLRIIKIADSEGSRAAG